jgi:hypothetical protein
MDDSWAELMIVMVRTLLLPAFKTAECFFWTGTIQNSNNTLLPAVIWICVGMMIPGRNWQSSCSEYWRCQLSEPRNGVLGRGPSFLYAESETEF